jgi:hypothetical protein
MRFSIESFEPHTGVWSKNDDESLAGAWGSKIASNSDLRTLG